MYTITVFTTTYNRAYTLPRVYESLKRQTSKDFCWLIIDDGSKDNTQEIVREWEVESIVPIKYIFQENKGMLGGHNTAYDNIDTELSVCIDSDDYMPDDAIEKILTLWKKNKHNSIAGLVGLDAYQSGEIIGTKLPEKVHKAFYHELFDKYKIKGDKKYVFRTDIINKFPRYPIEKFPDEKFPAQGYLYRLIGQEYPLLLFNEVFCIVEYLEDGNSNNKLKSFRQNPNAFAFYRKEMMRLSSTFSDRCRHTIHYISSCIFAKKYPFYGKNTALIILLSPLGLLLNLFIRYKTK